MPKYTNIFLDTSHAVRDALNPRISTFYNMPLIQIKKKSYLYLDTNSMGTISTTDRYRVKLRNIKYNDESYYSTEPSLTNTGDGIILAVFSNTGGSIEYERPVPLAELPPQDINTLILEIVNIQTNVSMATNHQMKISLVVEEIDDEY